MVLLIVNFLKYQINLKKNIVLNDGNLGRLFYEFLYYYGIEFEAQNNIIDTHGTYDKVPYFDTFVNIFFIINIIIVCSTK